MQKFKTSSELYKSAPMAQFVKRLKHIGLTGYIGLVLYYPWYLLFAENSLQINYIPLMIFWLPMLTAIKGLLQGNPYTYAWSNFVLMWCFLHGLTALWTFTGNIVFVVVEITLLTMAFIGNTYFARYRGRELGLALPKLKDVKQQEKDLYEKK